MNEDWLSDAQKWLQEVARDCYNQWLDSRDGKRYRKSTSHNKNPYKYGFSLPEWFHDAIEATKQGDEEKFKAIKMIERWQ